MPWLGVWLRWRGEMAANEKRAVELLGGPADGQIVKVPADASAIAIPRKGRHGWLEMVYRISNDNPSRFEFDPDSSGEL